MSDLPLPDPIDSQAAMQALDIQHDTDPADDHGPARRIPHMGHALLFFGLVGACLLVCSALLFAASGLRSAAAIQAHPGVGLAAEGAGYLVALLLSLWIFPHLWQRRFFEGVHWNALVARRRWPVLVAVGTLVSVVAGLSLRFVSLPQNAPVDQLMQNPRIIWVTLFFAVVIGPFMEELAFRGFLLPALATAYDWISLERTPAALVRWESSTGHTPAALLFAALVSSAPFALMHAPQIGFAWGAVGILYGVSLVFTFIRIRTQSLACSTIVHATYNGFIFVMLFVSTSGFRHLERVAR